MGNREAKVEEPAGELSEELICEKAEQWKAAHGKYPSKGSGDIPGTRFTWLQANSWLVYRGSSIAGFLGKSSNDYGNISEESIRRKAEEWKTDHGKYPNLRSGTIPGLSLTWRNVDSWLERRGSSLARLLGSKNTRRFRRGENPLGPSESIIREKIDEWMTSHGRWPTRRDGLVPGTDVDWGVVIGWIAYHREMGVERFMTGVARKEFSEEFIRAKGEEWKAKNGKYPKYDSGEIPGTSWLWRNADAWLHRNKNVSLKRFFHPESGPYSARCSGSNVGQVGFKVSPDRDHAGQK